MHISTQSRQLGADWEALFPANLSGLSRRDQRLVSIIKERLEQGAGQGHLDQYQSWLKLTKKNTSRESNQSTGSPLRGYLRRFNYMAQAERQFAVLLHWLGASDIREQFPLWPVQHPHPLSGIPGAAEHEEIRVPGLLTLSEKAGISHGWEVGSSVVPYVATVDFMVTVHTDGIPRLVAFCCKPKEKFDNADAASSLRRRTELERIYMRSVGCSYRLAHPETYPRTLYNNLQLYMPDDGVRRSLLNHPRYELCRELLKSYINVDPIREAIRKACAESGMDQEFGNDLFHLAAWNQDVDIDLSLPVAMTKPANRGGRLLYMALQQDFFGRIDRVLA